MSPRPAPDRLRSTAPSQVPPTVLVELAEYVHHVAAPAAPVVVGIDRRRRGPEQVTAVIVPAIAPHPADPLVGLRADARWSVVGLVATGRLRAEPGASPAHRAQAGPVAVTYLRDREGDSASCFGPLDGPLTTTVEPPTGWVPDVLARCMGQPTAPPELSVAGYLDALWLDRLAQEVFRHPDHRWTWPRVAATHPFADAPGTPSPPTPRGLSELVRGFTAIRPWSVWRTGFAPEALGGFTIPDAFGRDVSMADWFDDGSLSRWLVRDLAPTDILLGDLLATLTADVADCVLTALADTQHPAARR